MSPPSPGDRLAGRFRLDRSIGEGTFSWVFAAVDEQTGRAVALKILKPERLGHGDAGLRFEARELVILTRIQAAGGSTHIVGLVEPRLFWHGTSPMLVLELVAGPSLRERLAESAPLPLDEAHRLAEGLARGLTVLHAAGGVHRDLKPDNVRLRDGVTAVLVDLGIARALWETQPLTVRGAAPLTPRYAAPEQLRGLPATPAADVYAWGVCLFEMLTGNTPPAFPKDPAAFRRDIPAPIASLVVACLDEDPSSRPTAEEIVRSLSRSTFPRRPGVATSVMAACLLVLASGERPVQEPSPPCTPLRGFALMERSPGTSEAGVSQVEMGFQSLAPDGAVGPLALTLLPAVSLDSRTALIDNASGALEIVNFIDDRCREFLVEVCAEGRVVTREGPGCTLPRPIPLAKSGFALGDVDGDGREDLVSWRTLPGTREKPTIVRGVTRRSLGEGREQLIDEAFDLAAIQAYRMDTTRRLGDIDRDGCADLVIVAYPNGGVCLSSVYVLRGDCTGHFLPINEGFAGGPPGLVAVVPLPANTSDLGDVDEDGWLDLVTGPDDDGDPGQTFLLRGNGAGFGEAEASIDVSPMVEQGSDLAGFGSVLLEDWDQDGHLDLLVGHTTEPAKTTTGLGRAVVYLGRGDGSFADTPSLDKPLGRGQSVVFLPVRGR